MPANPNPFLCKPDHPNYKRRSVHHDYTRPARYLITLNKAVGIPAFSHIEGNPREPEEIKILLSEVGRLIREAILKWQEKYPVIVPEYAIMPDHVHLCVKVIDNLPTGLSRAVGNFCGMATNLLWLSFPDNLRSERKTSVFAKGFNDRIAYDALLWHNQLRYTVDNPRRYLIKKLFPDYLYARWILTLPDGRQYILRGNIFLLRQPELFRVKTSRSYTPEDAARASDDWHRKLYRGAIPVSPFIHKHEKEFRDEAVAQGFSYIRICANGFGEREAPAGSEFELISGGRVLLVGQSEHSTRKDVLQYDYAHQLNRLALEIVELCNSGGRFSIKKVGG